jgi:hypothetical protein
VAIKLLKIKIMLLASDAKKLAEKFLTSEDGQIKIIDGLIHDAAAKGEYSISYAGISDSCKSKLKANGYNISDEGVISW